LIIYSAGQKLNGKNTKYLWCSPKRI